MAKPRACLYTFVDLFVGSRILLCLCMTAQAATRVFFQQMANNTEKDMKKKWKKIRAAISGSEAVDEEVEDLLVGMGRKPLSEAAEKVKEAVGVVQAYVTGVHAVVADAQDAGASAMRKRSSKAKDDLYAAVEGLRGAIAAEEVKRQDLTVSWDEIKKEPDFSSQDPGATLNPEDGFKSHVKDAAEHVSSVSDALKKADGAANSAMAVVALATKQATNAVDEAPDAEARMAARRAYRKSVSPTISVL